MGNSEKNWKNKIHTLIEESLSVEPVAHTIQDVSVGDTFIHNKKHFKVTDKSECEGMWRTHVHINKSNCFDIRTPIRLV